MGGIQHNTKHYISDEEESSEQELAIEAERLGLDKELGSCS